MIPRFWNILELTRSAVPRSRVFTPGTAPGTGPENAWDRGTAGPRRDKVYYFSVFTAAPCWDRLEGRTHGGPGSPV
jgi:hypothetical protein